MQAIILAGGKGTRLKPYTTILPKPLMPISDMPILEIILRQLKASGFNSVILAVGYMSQIFESFFQNGERFGLSIKYSLEEKPLGTAGPIALALDQLQDNFLVMNGDLLTTLNFKKIYDYHVHSKSAATIAIHRRTVHIDYGVIESSETGHLIGYREKPVFNFDVSMGINVINKAAVQNIVKPGVYLDIPDLMTKITTNQQIVNCYREECEWLDIGRVDDYQKAVEIFETNKELFLPGHKN